MKLFLLWLYFLCAHSSATCYYPDGNPITPTDFPGAAWTDYVPCNSDPDSISMCCASNRTVNNDKCLPNGLCRGPGGTIFRESCSDPTWNSPLCLPDVCTNSSTGGNFASDSRIAQCAQDGSWCCGVGVTPSICCGMKSDLRFFLAPTIGLEGDNVLSTLDATSSAPSPPPSIPASAIQKTTMSSITSLSSPTTTSSLIPPMSNSLLTSIHDVVVPLEASTCTTTSSSYNHYATPATTSSPAETTESSNSTVEKNIHIVTGAATGSAFIILASLITYCFISRRRRKRKLEQRNSQDTEISVPTDSDTIVLKPELDTWEEIHMIGEGKERSTIYGGLGKAELHGEDREIFELEGKMKVDRFA